MRPLYRRVVVRRAFGGLLAAGVAVGALITLAAPASAVLAGGCSGQGTFAKGSKADGKGPFIAEAIPASKVITVPLKDSVTWSGSVPVPATQRNISGYVKVKLPWPLPGLTVDSWGGPSSKNQNNGVKDYKLPSLMPRNTEFRVYGVHIDSGAQCAGFVRVKIEGSAFDTPVTYVALLISVLLLGGFFMTGRAKAGA